MDIRVAADTSDERLFAEIAAGVDVGLYVYQVDDPDDAGSLRLVYANPASVAATGVELDAIVGKPIREAFPQLIGTPLPQAYLDLALGGEPRGLDDVKYWDHGVARQMFSVHAFPLPNRSVGLSFTNLTAQRVAERHVVQTLESMSDAFFMVDADWRFTYLNPQSEPILERRREDLIGKNMWEEFPEGALSGFHDAYHRAVRDQVMVQIEEHYEPLGRTLQVRAYPIAGGGLAAYYRDVTAERAADARRLQAQRLEALGRVTAGVAHDFNNLLAAIRGFASLGETANGNPEKTAKYFTEIRSAGEKATQLTRQLLAFGAQQDLRPVGADLNDMVSEYASILRQLVPLTIDLKVELAPEPVPVFVDPMQMEQVLLNLVVNSRDAIEETGTITVSTSTSAPVGLVHTVTEDSAWLQVTDTGAGIPADVAPRIFEPFFTTKPPEIGTGLGLATIYGIASQSGGDVYVDSTPDVGTAMTVVLPARSSNNNGA